MRIAGKRKRDYKQPFAKSVGYESDGYDRSTPTPIVEAVYPDEKTEEEAAQSTLSCDQAERWSRIEAWLKNVRGFPEAERKVVRLRLYENATIRKIAKETGMSASWVGAKLKSHAIKEVLEAHQTKLTFKPSQVQTNPELIDVIPLRVPMEHLREEMKNYRANPGPDGLAMALQRLNLPDGINPTRRNLVLAFRCFPFLLPDPVLGPTLIADLQKLLNDSLYGSKSEAATAREALDELVRRTRGNPICYPPEVMASELLSIGVSLKSLRQAWNADHGIPIRRRLEIIRQAPGSEEFGDRALQSLMSGDLIVAAARVAEKATGINAEVFEAALRKEPSSLKSFIELNQP